MPDTYAITVQDIKKEDEPSVLGERYASELEALRALQKWAELLEPLGKVRLWDRAFELINAEGRVFSFVIVEGVRAEPHR